VLVFVADYQRWYELFCHYEDEVRHPGLGDLLLACDDALIAAQNAVVAAESMGIGSCYIGDIMEQYETHRDLFGLPKYAVPAAMVVFGYPSRQQQERKKPERLRPEAVVSTNSREEDFERWIKAFCKRKWNSDFSAEMSRSVEAMMAAWKKEE